ncbi:MAG: zinc ABC transporter substrate-binding protein [Planctomycetaceae bacterium]
MRTVFSRNCSKPIGSARICRSFLLLAVLLSGCQDTADSSASQAAGTAQKINVLATVGMVADLVKQIGGDHTSVKQLMGSGVDPHLYKATRDDMQQIMSVDIVFSSGLMLEGRLQDTLEKVSAKRPVFAITSRLPAEMLLAPDGGTGHPDPHVWMDVAAWASCVDVIVDSLSELDAQHADAFRANAALLREQLQALHEYGLSSIASIPQSNRILVTSHDAFSYFGRAYGLEVVGVQGLSTESEAGLQRINELVDLLVERKVSAVFVESSVPRKNILALIDGAKSRGHDVKVGGELYSDAMGAEGTYEGTYVGMLDHNITLVTRALGGTVPDGGLNGKLKVVTEQP